MALVAPDKLDQLPARMINEYAYCPRLFYLEYVQQEWSHNTDTLEGRFVHRRVDQQKGSVPAAADLSNQVKLHSRSVRVGSDTLGAVAQIDLIEIEDGQAIPVDYNRGAAPDIAEGAWEPERVQVCLQGLLLRENGYSCDYGILYFAASQERVIVQFSDDLIARTLDLLAQARQAADSGMIPPRSSARQNARAALSSVSVSPMRLIFFAPFRSQLIAKQKLASAPLVQSRF